MFRAYLLFMLPFCAAIAGCSGSASGTSPVSSVIPLQGAATHSSKFQSSSAGPAATLSDGFSTDTVGGSASGWTVVRGTWSVCKSGTSQAYCSTAVNGISESLAGSSAWTDYTLEATVTNPNVAVSSVGIIGRAASPNSYYTFRIRTAAGGAASEWYLDRYNNGMYTQLAMGALHPPDSNPNYRLRLSFLGSTIGAAIAFDGGAAFVSVAAVTDTTISSGQIGLRTIGTTAASFSNVGVVSHAPLLNETPLSSAGFVDSIGVNGGFYGVSAVNYPQVRSLIGNLGIRHFRIDAWPLGKPNAYNSELADLHASFGVKYDLLSDLHTSPATMDNLAAYLSAGSVEFVEGPNEPDCVGSGPDYDPNFARDVPGYMQGLHTAIKSNPNTSTLPIIGPSFQLATSYAAVGDLSNYVDFGNTHDYFSGNNPGTSGFGANGFPFAPNLFYGSIDWALAESAQATGSKPVISTETGYCTAAVSGCISEDVKAKYILRAYLEHTLHKVPHAYLFKLLATDSSTVQGTYGIITPSLAVTPSYNALAGFIGILKDGGGSTPSTVALSFDGQTPAVHHLSVYKADGTLIIPVWLEVASRPGVDSQLPVNVNVAQNSGTATIWSLNARLGTWTSVTVPFTGGSIPLTITDSPTILEIKPRT